MRSWSWKKGITWKWHIFQHTGWCLLSREKAVKDVNSRVGFCFLVGVQFPPKPLWKYITLRNRPGGVSVSICADDRAAGDARKNILGGYYHGNLWLEAKDKMDIFMASQDPPILVALLDSVCLPSMATRTRTLYPQASSASNGIHILLFCMIDHRIWLHGWTTIYRPK